MVERKAVYDFLFSVSLNVVFFALFVTAFFFVMVSRMEVKTVEANVGRATKEMSTTITGGLNATTKATLKQSLTTHLDIPDLTIEDNLVKDKNKKLLKDTWIILGSSAGGILALSTFLAYMADLDIKQHYIDALIILMFVAAAEFLFLFVVVRYYESIDTHETKVKIVDTIQKFIDTQT